MKLLNLNAVEFNFAGLQAAIDSIETQPFFIRLEDLQQKLFQIEIDQKKLSFYEIENPDNRHTLEISPESKERFFYRGVDLKNGEKVLAFWCQPPHVGVAVLAELRQAWNDLITGKVKTIELVISDSAILSGFVLGETDSAISLVQIPTWRGNDTEEIIGREPYELEELMEGHGAKEGLFNNVWVTFLKDAEKYTASFNSENNTIFITTKGELAENAATAVVVDVVAMEEVNWNDKALIDAGIAPTAPAAVELKAWADGRGLAYLRENFDNVNFDSYIFRHPDGQFDQVTFGARAIYNEQVIEALIHRYTTLNEEMPHEANVRTKALLEEILEIQSARYAETAAARNTQTESVEQEVAED